MDSNAAEKMKIYVVDGEKDAQEGKQEVIEEQVRTGDAGYALDKEVLGSQEQYQAYCEFGDNQEDQAPQSPKEDDFYDCSKTGNSSFIDSREREKLLRPNPDLIREKTEDEMYARLRSDTDIS